MKKLILITSISFSIVIITISKSFCQDKRVIENDPLHSKNLSLIFFPAFADLYAPNWSLGMGLQGNFRVKNLIEFNASIYKAYFDKFAKGGNEFSSRIDEKANNNYFGVTFYFKKIISDKERHLGVSGDVHTLYVSNFRCKDLFLFGTTLGFEKLNTYMNSGAANGIDFIGNTKNGNDTFDREFSDANQSTFMRAGIFDVGIVMRRIRDIKYYYDRELVLKSTSILYAKLLYAPKITLSNIYDPNDNLEYIINEKTVKSHFGFCGGIELEGMRNLINFTLGLEIGCRPGPGHIDTGTYGLVKVGMALNGKI